ncbi:Retrotransposon-like protein 1 [Phytophthora citrophthora]|uniref:Retrotransposon-like protein 1 n=1 Tax=Phytophthora citrophthora TaxID=4793 RepID=A0AAD9G4F5_9STRA|nr:Retrotransposon-like protein 1 [Phytophthora citrophthora]
MAFPSYDRLLFVRMESYERGVENSPMDQGSTGTPHMSVMRTDCAHLSDPEWEALQRLSQVIGEAAVATMLRTLSPTEQHGVDIVKEQRDVAASVASPKPRVESLKLHVSTYTGKEDETLLRWLVELDTAVAARRIVDPMSKVAFAMSCLGGRARSWAYGRRLSDPTCFSTYEVFKEELKLAFEPPKNEFRSRAEFLDLQQGKDDVHTFAQRARYLISNIVANPIDEATKVVTFMKGLRDDPVKMYLFQEYPNTLEEAISLAMQEEFSRRQAKLHANTPRPARSVAKTGGPEPMDLSSATTAGQQQLSRVELGHATLRTAAPSEKVSRCDMQDDKPNLVILNVMSKRVNSLRALVDSGASNNFVRQESLRSLDFEEADTPRGVLEVRLATGATVRTEKRVVRVCFSYKRRTFVEDLIVLDLDDKFDLVLGMPWLARHDPVINWEKRTLVRFNNTRATESDGTVSATHAPDGACGAPVEAAAAAAASDHRRRPSTTPGVVERKCVSTQKSEPKGRGHMIDGQVNAIHLREGIIPVLPVSLEVLQAPKGRADDVASTPGVDEANKIRGTERRASAPGADATGASLLVPGTSDRASALGADDMCTSEHSLSLKASESTSTPGVDGGAAVLETDCAAGGAGGCKRPAPEQPACSRAAALHAMSGTQAGLECASQRKESADDYCDNVPSKVRCLGRGAPGAGLQGRPSRRKLRELRESQSGTETGVSAVQTPSVETLNVLTLPEDAVRESADEYVGVDRTSNDELEALHAGLVRWTHRTNLHSLGCRESGS